MNLNDNLVNLNYKCHNYVDCYNCTLARCEWGQSDFNKKIFDCKMPVVDNFEEHDDEEDHGPIRKEI